jgi:hypothetical protein
LLEKITGSADRQISGKLLGHNWMNLHLAKVMAEARFHERSSLRIQRHSR